MVSRVVYLGRVGFFVRDHSSFGFFSDSVFGLRMPCLKLPYRKKKQKKSGVLLS